MNQNVKVHFYCDNHKIKKMKKCWQIITNSDIKIIYKIKNKRGEKYENSSCKPWDCTHTHTHTQYV